MAVYRVQRTRDYTVMSNYHLKDKGLTLKSKGLLSMILSLPEEWNYTTRGLASICKEGVDAIGSALKELETAGYIVRRQLRGANFQRKEVHDMNEKITAQPPKEERQEVLKEIRQLENRKKILENKQRNEERRVRTRRLIERGAILEGIFPLASSLSGAEVKAFLIALSYLPGAAELTANLPKSGDMP